MSIVEILSKSSVSPSDILSSFPKSIQSVYLIIEENGKISFEEILTKCTYSERTIRYALKQLHEFNLILKLPDLHDLRKYHFALQNQS